MPYHDPRRLDGVAGQGFMGHIIDKARGAGEGPVSFFSIALVRMRQRR